MTRLLLFACAAVLLAGPAVSAPNVNDRTVTQTARIGTSDLNLTSSRDARKLLRRAAVRIADLCALTDSSLNRDRVRDERGCAAQAMARFVGQLNAPAVTAEFARQRGSLVTLANAR